MVSPSSAKQTQYLLLKDICLRCMMKSLCRNDAKLLAFASDGAKTLA